MLEQLRSEQSRLSESEPERADTTVFCARLLRADLGIDTCGRAQLYFAANILGQLMLGV